MKIIHVIAERTYEVSIGSSYVDELLEAAKGRTRVAVIFDSSMQDSIPRNLSTDAAIHFFPVSTGEEAKTTQTILALWDWLGAAGFTRSDLIVAIGGGAVSDVAGFAAASWLRGIDWVAIPTTVAAMVDAAIGGKTGINSDYGKNLIGAFHSPSRVIIDFSWLSSLSDRDFSAGLAEVIKCGFIADEKILSILESSDIHSLRTNINLLAELVERSVAIKASVVSSDFKESGAREALNYGHTFAHAVEKDSGFTLRHGEAVAIGLVFVAHLSYQRGAIDEALMKRHTDLLSKYHLPISYTGKDWLMLLAHMKLDKKARGSQIRFVALDGIGKTQRFEDVTEEELHRAYESIQL